MPHEGVLFILIGPSGAGKNTLMQRVQTQLGDLPQLATMTTRPMRDGEKNGREHWFVSEAEFKDSISTGALVEWQQVHMHDWYGTPRRTIEDALSASRDLIADIEFLGASQVHAAYPDHTILIFITPSDIDVLASRIAYRGDISPEALKNRLARARFEMTFAPRCHYLVVNDEIEQATSHLRQIIESERVRRRGGPSGFSPTARHIFHTRAIALIEDQDRLLVRAHSSQDANFPATPVPDSGQLPHEILTEFIQRHWGCSIMVEGLSDTRFDFVAPAHVTIERRLPDVYFDFYYRCRFAPPAEVAISGWEWRSLSDLTLPESIRRLLPD